MPIMEGYSVYPGMTWEELDLLLRVLEEAESDDPVLVGLRDRMLEHYSDKGHKA